jgi:DNA polymerase (family X)
VTEAPATAPTVHDVAAVLAEIGVLMELTGKDSFRARAFANAARALEASDADLLSLAREGRLSSLRGVGAGIAAVIAEIVLDGRSTLHDELQTATPLGLYDLLRVQGLGPKRIHTLHSRLGVDSLDTLERAARAGAVAGLPGFGEKTQRKILAGIDFARASRQLRRYPEALELGARLLEWLRGLPEVHAAELVGALRRRLEVVDRIDLLAACNGSGTLARAAQELQGVVEVGDDGDEVRLELSDGVVARMRCVVPEAFVPAVVWETGSAAHVAQLAGVARSLGGSFDAGGLLLDGVPAKAEREEEVYERLGLAYVPPELREGLGEVEAAAAGPLPRLVEESDLSGTFHCHSTYSDGKASVEEMASAARARGWSYLGLADHSRTAAYAGGLSVERVRAQHAEIDALNARMAADGGGPFRLIKGIESDILPDGSLDYPDDVLASFDYVVGSVHSSFGMAAEEMTRRMIRAVNHPALSILGHPAGRLLLTRDGYALDLRAVLDAAAERGVVVEINANPHRLDLDWREVRYAAERGILIAINPDAHSVAALDHVAFGINMARKAGLEPRQVLNTWPLNEVLEYFDRRKAGAKGR